MSTEPLVSVQQATFRYFERDVEIMGPEGPKGKPSTRGITDVTLTARAGERVLVLGRNGSGKSTLLSILAGKRQVQQGSVTVLGSDAFNDTSLNHKVSLIGVPWPPEAYFANTVNNVAGPPPDAARRADIARRLHLPLGAQVDKMSSGEKRRVQILHGMLYPPRVLLLDECSTEVDVAERATVLQMAADECDKNDGCCFYATHILDGVEAWATRVILVEDGRIVRDEPYSAALAANKLLAHEWLSREPFEPFPAPAAYPYDAAATADAGADAPCAIVADGQNFTAKNGTQILTGLTMHVPKGSRTLLVGCNGSGKSTLLHMLVGREFFPKAGAVLRILGKQCYHDMSLNHQVAFGGMWWPKAPDGQMHVKDVIAQPVSERSLRVQRLLHIDPEWDLRHISSGELKRVQLLLALEAPSAVVVLDEATADLDLDMRHILLHFLYEESVERGVTVLYTTHIFEGLGNWATDCIVMDRTAKRVVEHMRGPEVQLPAILKKLMALKAAETFVEYD
jgi:CCR4-NOT complex subunit CAF16